MTRTTGEARLKHKSYLLKGMRGLSKQSGIEEQRLQGEGTRPAFCRLLYLLGHLLTFRVGEEAENPRRENRKSSSAFDNIVCTGRQKPDFLVR